MLDHIVEAAGEKPTLATYRAGLDAVVRGMRSQQDGGGEREKGVWADRAVRVWDAMLAAGVAPDARAVEGVLLPLVQVCSDDNTWLGGCMGGKNGNGDPQTQRPSVRPSVNPKKLITLIYTRTTQHNTYTAGGAAGAGVGGDPPRAGAAGRAVHQVLVPNRPGAVPPPAQCQCQCQCCGEGWRWGARGV